MKMYHAFASDNTAGMCPEVLEILHEANHDNVSSYGNDPWTSQAADGIRELFECDCDVYFVSTGTAANSLALASMCASYQSVICHELAHIETDECGAPEFFSNGSKILTVGGANGKMDADRVRDRILMRSDTHYPRPTGLSLSQATESGTVYTGKEADAVIGTAKEHGLRVHMDGARFFNAAVSLSQSPAELTWKRGVDVLCLSGTKNGMGIGEAVVFFDRSLSKDFAYRCKQSGQLVSKMRFLSAPWVGLLTDGVWERNARRANEMAARLRKGLDALDGVSFAASTDVNGVFIHLPESCIQRLRQEGWMFYTFIGSGFARFLCSWKTTTDEVDALVAAVSDAL
jgi:threonine aldolase